MIIHIVQEKDLPNFGYVEEGEQTPTGVRRRATLDTGDRGRIFADWEPIIRCDNYPDLHHASDEIMQNLPTSHREVVHAKVR